MTADNIGIVEGFHGGAGVIPDCALILDGGRGEFDQRFEQNAMRDGSGGKGLNVVHCPASPETLGESI